MIRHTQRAHFERFAANLPRDTRDPTVLHFAGGAGPDQFKQDAVLLACKAKSPERSARFRENKASSKAGINPLTELPLLPGGKTCLPAESGRQRGTDADPNLSGRTAAGYSS